MFVDFRTDKPIFDAIRVVGGKFDQRDMFAITGAIAEARRLQNDKPIFDVALLQRDLDRFEDAVAKAAPGAGQNQYDAMVCLGFNIGIGAFGKSSVLRFHKSGDHRGAADAFGMWVMAGGRVLAGLRRRRAAEAQLYRSAAG